jgi:hypothetical protein
MADDLVLTVRLHDPKEKQDATLSAHWVTQKIPRSDMHMSKEDFVAKYLAPVFDQFAKFKR